MRILITNDDGVLAPGVKALHGALSDYADCVVVAPHEDRSGASSSLSLDRPLRPFTLENGFVGLNGTPTDCVHLGLNAFYEDSVDMVVAGINHGANLGDDVLYSGTVAAALRGDSCHAPRWHFRWWGVRGTTWTRQRISPGAWSKAMINWTCRRAPFST